MNDCDGTGEIVRIPAPRTLIEAGLRVPDRPRGFVIAGILASSRDQSVHLTALLRTLNDAGLGTLLDGAAPQDLLRGSLQSDMATVVQIAFRLQAMTDWLAGRPDWHSLPFGYFSAGGHVSPALLAASCRARMIRGVVACCGSPLLAGDAIRHVRAPTLLIVDPEDAAQVRENRVAQHGLQATNALKIVIGANGLLDDHDARSMVSELARDWFLGIFDSSSYRPRH